MEYTILIADDDAELVRMLKTFFELRKYRVITARNGTEALKMAEQAPDLILLDINMPGLISSGINMQWVDASEGSFAAPATVEVVKNCKNPELAQLFVEYLICNDTQNKIAEVLNEAPVNKNATMDDSLKTYLAFGDESMNALKEFDEAYITANKEAWIDTFQRTVAVQ